MKNTKYKKEQYKIQKESLNILANMIIKYVKQHNIHILRYDSKSSESIYLKFDYGVAGSLRLSSHMSKKDLHYTFNLLVGLKKPYKETVRRGYGNIYRYYYSEKFVGNLAQDIVRYKQYRLYKYGEIKYNNLKESNAKYTQEKMSQPKNKKNIRSFWCVCKEA